MDDSWFRVSREQAVEINRLSREWLNAADPVVVFEAATLLLLNILDRDVPEREREPAVETVYSSLLGVLSGALGESERS